MISVRMNTYDGLFFLRFYTSSQNNIIDGRNLRENLFLGVLTDLGGKQSKIKSRLQPGFCSGRACVRSATLAATGIRHARSMLILVQSGRSLPFDDRVATACCTTCVSGRKIRPRPKRIARKLVFVDDDPLHRSTMYLV